MSTRTELKRLVRSPEGFESLGKCLLNVIRRRPILGFFCFSEFEREIYVYPPVRPDAEASLLASLLDSEWREDPMEVFPRAFAQIGIPTGPGGLWVHSSFLTSGVGEKPIGAYAYVEDGERKESGDGPDHETLDTLLTELVRSRLAIRKYRDAFHEGDYLFALMNKLGSMLLNPIHRRQSLVTLLEMAIHVTQADVGLLLVRRGESYAPEVELGLSPDVVKGLRFVPDGDSVLDRVARTRQPVIIDDFSRPSVQVPRSHVVRVNGLAALPLLIEGDLLGLVCLAGGEAGREVSMKMIETLEAITAIIGIAVENEVLRSSGGPSRGDRGSTSPGVEEGASTPPLDVSAIEAAVEAVGVGFVISDTKGEVRYSNPVARSLFGGRSSGDGSGGGAGAGDALEWLRERWRFGRPLRQRFPFRGPSGRPIEVTVAELRGELLVTVLREEPVAREPIARARLAGELRGALARLRLGIDLLSRRRAGAGDRPSAGDEEVEVVLDRALAEQVRLCEDLEEGRRLHEEDQRRICSIAEIVEGARKRLAADRARVTVRPPTTGDGPEAVVLGDPLQLRRAFVRIFVDIGHRLEGGEITVSIVEDQGAVRVRLDFDGEGSLFRGGPRQVPSTPGGGRRPESSIGTRAASHIITAHGGTIANGRSAVGRRWTEIVLPRAPAGPGSEGSGPPPGEESV